MKLLVLSFLLKVIQSSWIDANYTQLNTVQCNNIYPFSFSALAGGPTGPRLIDWDLQDYTNLYAFENFSNTVHRNYKVNSKSSYVAILFEDVHGLQVGVTYETERAFKWLKVIKNAKPGGQSTLKIASFQAVTATTVTTSVRDGINDSIITVVYESTEASLIYIVTFKFLDGSVICGYAINKGTTSEATSVQSKVVWQSALFKPSSLESEKAIHFVFGLKNLDAVEIHYTLNQSPTLPVPSVIFNYKQVMKTRSNVNTNFSKVLGISGNSISQFQNTSIGPFGGKNLNFYYGSQSVLYPNNSANKAEICCDGGVYKSGNTCTCGTSLCYSHDKYHYEYTQFFYDKTYFNSLLFNAAGGNFNWYYSATAFLVETFTSTSTQISNQIYWYVNQIGQDGNQKQQLREYTYSFMTSETLTSYAVSQDAPGLCMTAGVSPGSQTTNIYLDDLRIQGELKLNQGQYQLCSLANPNFKSTWFCKFPDDMFWQIGLKTFQVGKSVKCRAQNTQVDQLHWGFGLQTIANKAAVCWVSTLILLEETQSSGTVIHLLQLKYPRTKSINYDSIMQNSAAFGMSPNPYDCSSILQGSPQHTYIQYSFLLPERNFVGFMKSYLNFGFNFAQNNEGTPITLDQGLYFYTIGVQNSGQTLITVETNNYFMRQTNLTLNSAYDFSQIIDLDFVNNGSVFPFTVSSNQETYGLSDQITKQQPVLLKPTYPPPIFGDAYNLSISLITSQLEDRQKWNQDYNWDHTIQPLVFFQDL